MRQVANKTDPDLRKNVIAHTTYQVGIEETVDKSNHLSKRVRSPKNWSYDNSVTSYTLLRKTTSNSAILPFKYV